MSNRHIQSVLLPAVLASSAVFSLLTLPFFFYQSQSDSSNDSVWSGANLHHILASENRDLTIRYIGGSMVLSVATGIFVVELQRRWQARVRQSTIQAAAQAKSAAASAPATSAINDPIEPSAFDPAADWLSSERASSREQLPSDWTSATSQQDGVAAERSWSEPSDAPTANPPSPPDVEPGSVMKLSGDYPTCRIWTNQRRRRLFALHIEGQYYGFFRLLPTSEAAMETAQQLSRRHHRVVVTAVEQQYAVWVWEPEAELELSSIYADV